MMVISGQRTSKPKSIASEVIHLRHICLLTCLFVGTHNCAGIFLNPTHQSSVLEISLSPGKPQNFTQSNQAPMPQWLWPTVTLCCYHSINTTESSSHNNYDMTKRPTTPQMSSFNSEFSGAQFAKAWLVLATWRHMWENTRVPEQSGQDQHHPQHNEVQECHMEFGQAWEEDISHFHLLWHPSSLPLVGHLYQGDQTGGTSGKLENILSTCKKCKSKLCQSKISYPPMYHK